MHAIGRSTKSENRAAEIIQRTSLITVHLFPQLRGIQEEEAVLRREHEMEIKLCE